MRSSQNEHRPRGIKGDAHQSLGRLKMKYLGIRLVILKRPDRHRSILKGQGQLVAVGTESQIRDWRDYGLRRRPDGLAGLGIPQAQRLIIVGRQHQSAVRTDSETVHRNGFSTPQATLAPVAPVPENQRSVHRPSSQKRTIAAKSHIPQRGRITENRIERFPIGATIPKPELSVVVDHGQHRTIRMQRQSVDAAQRQLRMLTRPQRPQARPDGINQAIDVERQILAL